MKIRFAVSPGGRPFDPADLVTFGETVERLGYDTIWLSDVPLGPIGDPIISLTYLAARTTKLKLGMNVVPIGRNPMVLARQLAQLDRLANGRLLISVVPGIDQPGERAALGSVGDRGPAIEETVGLLRRWWAGEAIDHESTRFQYAGIAVLPTPKQQPLELWLGGAGPKAIERVAAIADGWLTANMTPAEAGTGARTILARAAALGRVIDPEHFGISIPYGRRAIPDSARAALVTRRKHDDLSGIAPVGADEITALVRDHVAHGISKFVFRPLDPTDPVDDLTWLADVVLPLQT